MNRKKILNGGKKFYIHPNFTNYAASKNWKNFKKNFDC